MRRAAYPLTLLVGCALAACLGNDGNRPSPSPPLAPAGAPPAVAQAPASAPALGELAGSARLLPLGVEMVAEVRRVAATLLAAGKITADDAANVQQQADSARAALDVARAMMVAEPNAAARKLQATVDILTALRGYLASKE